MSAYKQIYCVRISKSYIFPNERDRGLIWWPCLLHDDHKSLLQVFPRSYPDQRAQLFVHALRMSKSYPVAWFFGVNSDNSVVQMPFEKEESVQSMSEKGLIRDFIDWYYCEYEPLPDRKRPAALRRVVNMALKILEESVANAEFPPIDDSMLIAADVSRHEGHENRLMLCNATTVSAGDSHKQSTTMSLHEDDELDTVQKDVELSSPPRNSTGRRVSISNEKKSSKKKGAKRKRSSSLCPTEKSVASSPGRVWGKKDISTQRISHNKKRKTSVSSSALNKTKSSQTKQPASNNFVTPYHKKTKPCDPGKPDLGSVTKSISSELSAETPLHELSWKYMWKELESRGWVVKNASNKLHNWYYLMPGVNEKTGILGEDYFAQPSDVMKFIKQQAQMNFGKNPVICAIEKEPKVCAPSPCSTNMTRFTLSSDKLSWKAIWTELKFRGWFYERARNPLHSWYYVRPGRNTTDGVLGVDYFMHSNDVVKFLRENYPSKNTEKNSIMEDIDEESKADQSSLSSNASESSMDSYMDTSFNAVFSKLRKLDFRFSGGKYVMPGVSLKRSKDQQIKPLEGKDYFESVKKIQAHLKRNGVPGLRDSTKLTSREKKIIYAWVSEAE